MILRCLYFERGSVRLLCCAGSRGLVYICGLHLYTDVSYCCSLLAVRRRGAWQRLSQVVPQSSSINQLQQAVHGPRGTGSLQFSWFRFRICSHMCSKRSEWHIYISTESFHTLKSVFSKCANFYFHIFEEKTTRRYCFFVMKGSTLFSLHCAHHSLASNRRKLFPLLLSNAACFVP